MLNIARSKGYKTAANALKKLTNTVGEDSQVHYLIAVNDEGRYVPVVMKRRVEDIALIHKGITVIG